MLAWLIDVVLHLDRHLLELLTRYELWIYPILFAVIFAETGLVVTPFLPGDSLLFAVGALAAVDRSGVLQAPLASVTLGAAAVLGVVFLIGRALYFQGYVRSAAGRHVGFILSAIPNLALLIGAIIGALVALSTRA